MGVARTGKAMALALGVAASVSGCGAMASMRGGGGTTVPLQTAESVPAATGSVKIRPERDGNQVVQMRVEHLAPAQKAEQGASAYVVWVEPRDPAGPPQNMGVLQPNEKLEGRFETKVPYKNFEVFVTPEERPGARAPSRPPVMRAMVRPVQRTIR
jgi:hypothetical protein